MEHSPQNNGNNYGNISKQGISSEAVVISGMSGLYPDCKSVKDLADVLYNKKNPVTPEHQRWSFSHPEAVKSSGKLSDLDLLDAQFFKINFRLADNMDPMPRKVLEQSYQAIYDAGISPGQLYGKKTGVFISTCFSETEKAFSYDTKNRTGFGLSGCNKSQYANRVSYWLNAKGPSMSIDAACCGSTAALEQAYLAISRGECEAAIVGGTNLCLHPQSLIHHGRLVRMCMDGKTKSFDLNANGCAKSEAVNVLFLQKAKNALRIYAEIVHVKTEFMGLENGPTGPKYGFCRSVSDMSKFLHNYYNEANVSPQAVEYVEAFGSAVLEADKSELEAFDNIFCQNKEQPLKIGSVMSNIGYTEGATGISAITKVLLGYETGILAANLHYLTPRLDISGIRDGRIQVLSDHMSFNRQYTAINGMSYTGLNSHVLLKGHYKPKNINQYKSNIPHLVTVSGRQNSAVNVILNDLKQRPIDPEELALLHNIHEINISGHVVRGFAILDTNKDQQTDCLKEIIGYSDDAKRPLWFVYSGMGSQWPMMGSQLMRIPMFAASIQRCQKVLESKEIDLIDLLTSPDVTIFDNILHSLVGIAAIQIGLTDILKALGVEPDKIIGHSAGEIGCAYSDGCLTAEETILFAYFRGLVFTQIPFIRGAMAAVGMGYKEISGICPPTIEVACRNSSESCTISGPEKDMREFAAKLVAKGIFVKEVQCSNIAYHSRYISEAGPILLKYLSEVLKTPKLRSNRWLSTSVPQDKWNEPVAQYCSAEYFTNNLLNPVLFEDVLNLIPSNAVVVEIAPHGLLQAILKRALHPNCSNISLTRRGHPDNVLFLLEAIGNLYMEGLTPKVQELYPKIQFPVSTGTPMLSHLVEWLHDERWSFIKYMSAQRIIASCVKFIISIHDEEYKYLSGNQIRGKTLYPFAAALVAVWDTLAMTNQLPRKKISVRFDDVIFYSQPVLHDQRQLRLHVTLQRGTGAFEIMDEFTKVASGFIVSVKVMKTYMEKSESEDNDMNVTTDDIYKLFDIRGYTYKGDFQSIHKGNSTLNSFSMHWNDNWVTLIDGLLQVNALRQEYDGVSQPLKIRELRIDVIDHEKHVISVEDKKFLKVNILESYDATKCGGILLKGLTFSKLPHATEDNISLRTVNVNDKAKSYLSLTNDSQLRYINKLVASVVGDINSLHWFKDIEEMNCGIKVKVHYAGLSSIDVSKVIGAIETVNNETSFGFDFSGVTISGDRVMGIAVDGSCKSTINARSDVLWPIPDHWSYQEAATVPMAYMTALYCLNLRCKDIFNSKIDEAMLVPDCILIHGGASALGQALITIALTKGYEVFTTVSEYGKKQFLMKLFPELKGEYIGNSRDTSFGDMVLSATKGRGCDITINCLKGNLKDVSLKCSSGWMLDVSMYDPHDDWAFGMTHLRKSRSYFKVNMFHLLANQGAEEIVILQKLLSKGISRGYVRPLSRVVYAHEEISRAFKLLVARRQHGRVLLQLDESLAESQPRIHCNPKSCYVILCGQDTFGLKLVQKLISRGAKKIFLHYDSLPGYLRCKIHVWKEKGIEVKISCEKIDSLGKINNVLNDATALGNIDGIIIDALHMHEVEHYEEILQNLDVASINIPFIRYFVVVTDDFQAKKDYLCTARQNNGLPFIILDLGVFKKSSDSSCIDAIDRAMASNESLVIAVPKATPPKSLLEKVCSISGLKLPDDCINTITLRELGVVDEKLTIVSNYFRDYQNITLIEDDVGSLTLKSIQEIEKAVTATGYQYKKGLESFYSYVEPDEILASTELVFMSTLTKNSTMRDDEFDVKETTLCIIPGLEGHHARFQQLCERLKLPAFVLQPGLDNLNETIEQTAQRHADYLLKLSAIKNNFYILGYEAGIFIALELTAILEKNGLTGTVFLLGGSPKDVLNEIENQLQGMTTIDELQEAIAMHMFRLMLDENTINNEYDDLLLRCSNWKERVDTTVRTLLGMVHHSEQYARAQIEASLARLVQARRYSGPAAPLRSRLVLLRSPLSARSDHTRLHRLSLQPLIQHDILAPLSHAPDDLRCAAIINKYLDDEIIKKFEAKNLCDTYFLNSDLFTSSSEI